MENIIVTLKHDPTFDKNPYQLVRLEGATFIITNDGSFYRVGKWMSESQADNLLHCPGYHIIVTL